MLRIIHISNDTTNREAIVLDTSGADEQTLLGDYRVHDDDIITAIVEVGREASILPTNQRLEEAGLF